MKIEFEISEEEAKRFCGAVSIRIKLGALVVANPADKMLIRIANFIEKQLEQNGEQ